jgi:hypothetical protein
VLTTRLLEGIEVEVAYRTMPGTGGWPHAYSWGGACMSRFDLTDFEWSAIAPMLPINSRGVRRVDDRRMVSA